MIHCSSYFRLNMVEDAKKFKAYVDHIGKARARKGGEWRSFYEAARRLKLG